ncbi:MAG TPA: UDP-N-acetylglucosamine 1-carboxyvinyltransferase [Acidimicrobiales bacterium]|nr:UDP-N-acetylglucosamine 1-carboxyvinyltransferase [Acidimicrobiales bacterium]
MSRFVVRPSGPLYGTVTAGGAKNAVLKEMAACLLAEGMHRLRNVPRITDVETMASVLTELGCRVHWAGEHELSIGVPSAGRLSTAAPASYVEQLRASIVVLGPLLARTGAATLPLPGGDDFGTRPVNFHLEGLGAMGADLRVHRGVIEASTPAPGRLRGARLTLEYPSHTATDNLLMAAVTAEGTTVIDNAAREPEVEDLAAMLNAMGADVQGLGTSRLVVEGVDALRPADHEVVPDRVVAATYLAAGTITGGEVTVADARREHMETLLRKLATIGADLTGERGITAKGPARPGACDVATLPYPGVATDYKPLLVATLAIADGTSVVTENLFEGRFRYVEELARLGARVSTEGHHVVIRGVERLQGAAVRATDVRAGAALVLAGLVADGETVVANAAHVDRGYEDLAGTLRSLGADVERV